MNTVSIPASALKPGDIMVREDGGRFRVDSAVTNPRLRFGRKDGDLLVDVDATGVGFTVPCQRFTSHTPASIVTIEVNS